MFVSTCNSLFDIKPGPFLRPTFISSLGKLSFQKNNIIKNVCFIQHPVWVCWVSLCFVVSLHKRRQNHESSAFLCVCVCVCDLVWTPEHRAARVSRLSEMPASRLLGDWLSALCDASFHSPLLLFYFVSVSFRCCFVLLPVSARCPVSPLRLSRFFRRMLTILPHKPLLILTLVLRFHMHTADLGSFQVTIPWI